MDGEPLPSAIASLSRAELLRDLETSSHARRSALIVRETSLELGLDAEQSRRIALASILHDIGKIAVPIELLQKTAPLSREEQALIRTHCRRGYEILHSDIDPLMALAGEIALHHHECFDGSGYPDHLAGTDIPLAAQIVAVCDSYDALRQNRAYRPGLAHADAMRILLQGDGRTSPQHFRPEVRTAFQKVSEKARSIFDAYDMRSHISGVMAWS